ncbi:hypothetical protein PHMEG_0004773 [Phytophthora megakarya]|uniref:Uncharacterized protein n=1 Tax=Phytophthora megakarya TaxID=4795 RepID=A0A225WUN6_9STRA|nr:hypothetical protein PHMEG_0004773 [Phytophthora megakarya]
MAWGKNRRHVSSSASTSSRPATGGRGRSRRPPGEPTEQDIARSIQQSAVRVRVALQLSADDVLSDLLAQFETKFEARRSHVLTQRRHVRVELLECGLNSWQHLVELQRVLMGLTRPNELKSRTTLRQDKYDEWTLSLTFARASEDALWRFASRLMLRLRSSGVLSKVLLGLRLVVPLESTFGGVEVDQYQWEGQLLCSEVMVTAGDLKEDIQRVFLPPIGHSDARKPVVVILRGIPGSGKSTLGRYVFDVKKLGAAHSTCKGDFARALEGDIPRSHGGRRPHQHVVLVDNTSTQKWEYEPYEDIARSHGSRVHIVEMKCSDALMAFRMGQRNSHGVPPDKVVSMFMRWEEDTRAHCFTPQFEYARLTANPLSDGDVGSLTYIEMRNLVHRLLFEELKSCKMEVVKLFEWS